jgi:hypothetical protein
LKKGDEPEGSAGNRLSCARPCPRHPAGNPVSAIPTGHWNYQLFVKVAPNGVWNANFWTRTTFRDVSHVQTELPFFEHYCRHRRPLPEFGGKTADQIVPDFVPTCLPAGFDLHEQEWLPITAGYVHFIRFVASAGTFSILNERWQLDTNLWAGKTIRATVDTQRQQLLVYHQTKDREKCQQIAQFDYPLGEPVIPLAEGFQRPRPAFWPPAE